MSVPGFRFWVEFIFRRTTMFRWMVIECRGGARFAGDEGVHRSCPDGGARAQWHGVLFGFNCWVVGRRRVEARSLLWVRDVLARRRNLVLSEILRNFFLLNSGSLG